MSGGSSALKDQICIFHYWGNVPYGDGIDTVIIAGVVESITDGQVDAVNPVHMRFLSSQEIEKANLNATTVR